MTAPKSLAAYKECEELFARALASDSGVAITLASKELATRMCQKMNTYRSMLRRQNRSVYEPNHPMYGASIYDSLQVSKDPNSPERLLIKEYKVEVLKVEEL